MTATSGWRGGTKPINTRETYTPPLLTLLLHDTPCFRYFYNRKTKESTWTRPEGVPVKPYDPNEYDDESDSDDSDDDGDSESSDEE